MNYVEDKMSDYKYYRRKYTQALRGERATRREAEALAASRLELLRRAAEFLEINNPVLKEIKKELGDD